jgi:hypothetical protein
MKELVFEVMQEADGGYTAETLGESIFTQADSWDGWPRSRGSVPTTLRVPPVPRIWGPGKTQKIDREISFPAGGPGLAVLFQPH